MAVSLDFESQVGGLVTRLLSKEATAVMANPPLLKRESQPKQLVP